MNLDTYRELADEAFEGMIRARQANRAGSGQWAKYRYTAEGIIRAIALVEVEDPRYTQKVINRLAALICAERAELGEEEDWDNTSLRAIWTQVDLLCSHPDVPGITDALDEALVMVESGSYYAVGDFLAKSDIEDNHHHSHICCVCWRKHPCEDMLLLRPEGAKCLKCDEAAYSG